MKRATLTHREVDMIRSALYSALNVQGATAAGCRLGAWAGLDAEAHDRKIRAALGALDYAAPEHEFPELACEDCNGTGMVPAIGPEDGEADGYVPCPTCREGGAA